jgi:copper chaperone CopZ
MEEHMTKTLFHVPNMHCSTCAMTLESIEDELDGVKRVNASYRKQEMEVEFDETRVSVVQIVARAKEMGYDLVQP